MAQHQLALAILLQVVSGHRRAVDARGVYQMMSIETTNLSAQRVAGSRDSTRIIEEAENKSDIEDAERASLHDDIKDVSDMMPMVKKRVRNWNKGAFKISGYRNQTVRTKRNFLKLRFQTKSVTKRIPIYANNDDGTAANAKRPGYLTTFQQAPGWCYANAVSSIHRYYTDGSSEMTQCKMATDICSMFFNSNAGGGAGCCAGSVPYGDSAKHRQPTNDFFMPGGFSPSYHLLFNGQQECCGEYGTYIPLRHTGNWSGHDFGTKTSYGRNQGKSWAALKAAIDVDKPFIVGTNIHYMVCYGYIEGQQKLLCHDGYYHHGGNTGEVIKTYAQYMNFEVKTHFFD